MAIPTYPTAQLKSILQESLTDTNAASQLLFQTTPLVFRGNHNLATFYQVGDAIWDDSGLAITVVCVKAHSNQATNKTDFWQPLPIDRLIGYAAAGGGILDDGLTFFSMDVCRIFPIGGPQSNLVNSNADIGSSDGVNAPLRSVALCGGSGATDVSDCSSLSHSYITGFGPASANHAIRCHADSSSSITDGTNAHSDSSANINHATSCRAGSSSFVTGASHASPATSCFADGGGTISGALANSGALGPVINSTTASIEIGQNDTNKIRVTANGLAALGQLSLQGQPTDTYAATMSIDVTHASHIISASFTTSSTVTFNASAAGNKGDYLEIITETDGSGSVVATFGTNLHSSGTQTTTSSKFSSIAFRSDGTRWIELHRVTALT